MNTFRKLNQPSELAQTERGAWFRNPLQRRDRSDVDHRYTETLTDIMVLVVKDSDDVETRDRKKQLPVVLGMYVLRNIENFLKECGASSIFQSDLHAQKLNRTSARGIARVAGPDPVLVPAESSVCVRITRPSCPSLYRRC